MKPRIGSMFLTTLFVCLLSHPNVYSQLVNVPGVYGTGVASPGVLIAEGSVDPHYTIISGPVTGTAYVVTSATMPTSWPWIWNPNGPTSSWISFSSTSTSSSVGAYVYRTTFDLTGFLPETAVLTGSWNTDNNGTGILLNGVSFNFTTSPDSYREGPSPFTITSGFAPGLNTLDFALFDGDVTTGWAGATGLRVDGLEVKAVPEPSTYALLIVATGAGALWWARRRR